jgi:hypothetical protein
LVGFGQRGGYESCGYHGRHENRNNSTKNKVKSSYLQKAGRNW